MKFKVSKIGAVLAIAYLVSVIFFLLMFPFSMGFSWLLVAMLSMPWNTFVSGLFDLQYGEMNEIAVLPGVLLNAVLLYFIGFGISRLIVQSNASVK